MGSGSETDEIVSHLLVFWGVGSFPFELKSKNRFHRSERQQQQQGTNAAIFSLEINVVRFQVASMKNQMASLFKFESNVCSSASANLDELR